jgi:exodeoxyribonuclease VII small subunit
MNETRNDERTFEEALLELERMVRELEDGQLGLEDALARYEQGVGLIKACYQQLRQAEQRILLLTGIDEEQQPILQPFKHEATALTKKRPLS